LGLGLWFGTYETGLRKIEGFWLRWYDLEENWILTDTEIERQRAEQERQRAELLAEKLRELNIDPDIVGLSPQD